MVIPCFSIFHLPIMIILTILPCYKIRIRKKLPKPQVKLNSTYHKSALCNSYLYLICPLSCKRPIITKLYSRKIKITYPMFLFYFVLFFYLLVSILGISVLNCNIRINCRFCYTLISLSSIYGEFIKNIVNTCSAGSIGGNNKG